MVKDCTLFYFVVTVQVRRTREASSLLWLICRPTSERSALHLLG